MEGGLPLRLGDRGKVWTFLSRNSSLDPSSCKVHTQVEPWAVSGGVHREEPSLRSAFGRPNPSDCTGGGRFGPSFAAAPRGVLLPPEAHSRRRSDDTRPRLATFQDHSVLSWGLWVVGRQVGRCGGRAGDGVRPSTEQRGDSGVGLTHRRFCERFRESRGPFGTADRRGRGDPLDPRGPDGPGSCRTRCSEFLRFWWPSGSLQGPRPRTPPWNPDAWSDGTTGASSFTEFTSQDRGPNCGSIYLLVEGLSSGTRTAQGSRVPCHRGSCATSSSPVCGR